MFHHAVTALTSLSADWANANDKPECTTHTHQSFPAKAAFLYSWNAGTILEQVVGLKCSCTYKTTFENAVTFIHITIYCNLVSRNSDAEIF